MYKILDFNKTMETVEILGVRISERFPDSSLWHVCQEFHQLLDSSQQRIEWLSHPNYLTRSCVVLIIVLTILTISYTLGQIDYAVKRPTIAEIITVSEAMINNLVLLGAALFFLVTLELRIKRSRILKALNELRSMAHVVDMHQLTKDPYMQNVSHKNTSHSPKRNLTNFQLNRYLDYCTELLALIGKLAAIYAQSLPDPTVVSTANDIEELCTSLSRKIWQKISNIKPDSKILN